ncbi:UvrD-helicase domain-containing protein [Proteus sp. TJ1640]|uniref:UvrD-helicase domain-containing protein n=1 Tax=Proteus sp. TJ1640 TaxID=2050968 RepID=UPI000D69EB27|nr:UvrD-helicase domain-containing protein [Proteus sp. TJ1640]
MTNRVEKKEYLAEEINIQNKINNHIKNNECFIFNAGAGAGKTHALKESINYILDSYRNELTLYNRKILCITYTNAATNEIKSRIGNTELLDVSTIHECFWKLISSQQNALRVAHRIKIENKIKELDRKFKNNKKAYDWLYQSSCNHDEFKKELLKNENISKYYSLGSESLRGILNKYNYDLNGNKGKFEAAFSYLYKKTNLENGLKNLSNNTIIKYDANKNSDSLHNMRISHDTLIEHTEYICDNYPLMLDIIIDKYPFILIDEYQDTNINTLSIFNKINKQSKIKNQKNCIGYFGDLMQEIYSDEEKKVENINFLGDFKSVNKNYNRRSYNKVIKVSNCLRDDSIIQKSIYMNNPDGNFYYKSIEKTEEGIFKIIDTVKKEFREENKLREEEKITSLVLKNETLANISGFGDLYKNTSKLLYNFGINYNEVSQNILGNEDLKLHPLILLLKKTVEFILLYELDNKVLSAILPSGNIEINIENTITYIKELQTIYNYNGKTLSDYLMKILCIYSSDSSSIFNKKFESIFDKNNLRIIKESIKNNLKKEGIVFNTIFSFYNNYNKLENIPEEKSKKIKESIDNLINTSFEQYKAWFKYLNADKEKIEYLTCHNSKGLEFDHVIVFLQNDFNRSKKYITDFIESMENDDKYKKIRNLLYVSFSRAIKNLTVIFIYDNDKDRKIMDGYFNSISNKI